MASRKKTSRDLGDPVNEEWLYSCVRKTPTDPDEPQVEEGVGLCLSGGGYRAMLFHLGVLWRLNELGKLHELQRISSVSGGSIVAGVLAIQWNNLGFSRDDNVASQFGELVVQPIRRFARQSIDTVGVLKNLRAGGGNRHIAAALRRHLFKNATLADLPQRPWFILNTSNLQSGVLCRFAKTYVWDYRVGRMPETKTVKLADAVAASAAFPPVLSPAIFRFGSQKFRKSKGADLFRPEFHERMLLTDGGVYDNLGLETVFKRYQTVLVANAGGQMSADPAPRLNWVSHTHRVLAMIDNQVRSLRKRHLIDAYTMNRRDGAYWSIRGNIDRYPAKERLHCPHDLTLRLANIPTRLRRLTLKEEECLINWGYALTDAAMRTFVTRNAPPPADFPYPDAGVDTRR